MDLETKKLAARLEALETALVVVARRDPGIQQAVQFALTGRYQEVLQTALTAQESGFLQNVHTEPRPSRDQLAEQAIVNAYRDLLDKVQHTN